MFLNLKKSFLLFTAAFWSCSSIAETYECSAPGFAADKLTSRKYAKISSADQSLPALSNVVELSAQPLCKSDTVRFGADVASFVSTEAEFRNTILHARNRAPAQSSFGGMVHEAYATRRFDASGTSTSIGKKRAVWGPGLFHNPTDLINPPKSPLDPLQQRTGSWLVDVDKTVESNVLSAVFSPGVRESKYGLPDGVMRYSSADEPATSHYLVAGRYSFIKNNTEMNLMVFNTHHFRNQKPEKFHLGLSASRTLDSQSFYGEMLITPITQHSGAITRSTLDALAGTQYFFSSGTILIVELLYQQNGLSLSQLDSIENDRSAALPMKNYLAIHYGDYKLSDKSGLSADLLASPQLQSGYTGPTVFWNFSEAGRATLRYLELLSAKADNSSSLDSDLTIATRIVSAELKSVF